MDYTAIISLVTTVGFPIVCVIFLWQYVNTTMKDMTETVAANTKIIEKLILVLDKNTSIISSHSNSNTTR